jgi:putative transposase
MRFAFIKEHRRCWPVALMCRVLHVSRNGFYDYVVVELPELAHCLC